MSRGKVYTLMAFFLSFTVVIGGWFLTKKLLNCKETEMLSRTGQLSMYPSGLSLLDNVGLSNSSGEITMQSDFKEKDLPENIMAKILAVWEAGGRQLLHEPQPGQMNMEQAISKGKDWITALSDKGILPSYLAECSFDKIDARLCSIDTEVTFDKALLSYWQVTYMEGETRIILTIHARSGQVWKAEIHVNADRKAYGSYSSEQILDIVFPDTNEENSFKAVVKDTVYKSFPEGKVYAAVKSDEIVVAEQEPVARLMLWLNTGPENYSD